VKRYGNYGRKVSWIVKRCGKYRRKLWNDMKIWKKSKLKCEMIWKYGRKASRTVIRYGLDNMEERQVE
jgi:hypothetical protein